MPQRYLRYVLWTVLVSILWCSGSSIAAVVISRPATRSPAEAKAVAATVQVQYDHGQPSNMEQYLLELVNRARSNPGQEIEIFLASKDQYIESAIASYSVDMNQTQADFNAYVPRPPLAFNAKLMTAARGHSTDMAEHDFQGHESSNGDQLQDRFSAVGYNYFRGGENVFAYAHSMLHAQAAFLIDWGVADLGHRSILLNLTDEIDFREIGIGVVSENSPDTAVGPWVVTEDFGTSQDDLVFVTGVVYRDINGNEFYDPGEGVEGVTVQPDAGGYYAVTSASGGYAIPMVPSSGTYQITADQPDLTQPARTVTVESSNLKLDFVIGDPHSAIISGTVKDESNLPLDGVVVTLLPIGLQTTSDTDGRFTFSDLTAGSYQLTGQREGYVISSPSSVWPVTAGGSVEAALTATVSSAGGSTDVPAGAGNASNPAAPVCGSPGIIVFAMVFIGVGLLSGRSKAS